MNTSPAPKKPRRYPLPAVLGAAAVLLLLAAGALYLNGNFDRPLYAIGLNYHECARNGLGATFCGQELDVRRREQQQAEQKSNEAQTQLKEEEEAQRRTSEREQAAARREATEATRKAEHESRVLQEEAKAQQEQASQELRESAEGI